MKGKGKEKSHQQEWRPKNREAVELLNQQTLAINTGSLEEDTQQFPPHCTQAPGTEQVETHTFSFRDAVAAALPDPKPNLTTLSSQAPIPLQGG